MGVVAEAPDELLDVLVHERVVRDLVRPLVELGLRGQLAERSSFLEVAYLLINGELPTRPQLEAFTHDVTYHTMVHETVRKFIKDVIKAASKEMRKQGFIKR